MEIRFANLAWRWLFLLAILMFAATLAILAAKNSLAEKWARSSKPEHWLRAAQLEPDNADYWHRLGRYRQLDFAHADLRLAIDYYHRALARDPRSAGYWLDLASAHEMTGDLTEALHAYETAEAVYPISAEVAWRHGNFLLRQGKLSEAFAQVRHAVTTDPRLATLAISRCWRASREIEPILNQALPAQSDVYLPAVDFLVSEYEADAALVVWERLWAMRPSLELRRAFLLIELLTLRDRVEEARSVWQQALQLAGVAERDSPGKSLVWDGGFEAGFLDGGFAWRQKDVAGAAFEFDTETRHSGARSLRITFDGTANLDFAHLLQFVPVEPRTRYRFAAYLRTQQLSTDSGIRFWIFDPRRPADLSVLTPKLVGTQPWALDEADFTTGPQTRLLEIVLRRQPSQKFDNKIQGTVWVDDVSLTPISEGAARRSP